MKNIKKFSKFVKAGLMLSLLASGLAVSGIALAASGANFSVLTCLDEGALGSNAKNVRLNGSMTVDLAVASPNVSINGTKPNTNTNGLQCSSGQSQFTIEKTNSAWSTAPGNVVATVKVNVPFTYNILYSTPCTVSFPNFPFKYVGIENGIAQYRPTNDQSIVIGVTLTSGNKLLCTGLLR